MGKYKYKVHVFFHPADKLPSVPIEIVTANSRKEAEAPYKQKYKTNYPRVSVIAISQGLSGE